MSRTAFVIGHPVAHSRSPLIHGFWLEKLGLEGEYRCIDVAPEALDGFFEAVRKKDYIGGNVTVPHKQAVMTYCDEIDETARTIGAVNTLVVDDKRLIGSNSDWHGFLANLDDRTPGWDQQSGPALVLGAGGAARAIIVGLDYRGFSPIVILNRTGARAEALADELDKKLKADITGASLARFDAFAAEARLVVNTSTIGMHGTRFNALPLDCLNKKALVTDIVYTPLETPLLADAAALGLKTVDGLGMLLHQAVPGFTAWFGQRPDVTAELRTLVERDMGLS